MKTRKLFSIGLATIMMVAFSQQPFAQLVNFYGGPGYTAFINTALSNSLMNPTGKKYTGGEVSKSNSTSQPFTYVIPEYRRYPAVQFKSTGTRLVLQEYLDASNVSNPQDKAELKELILKIFKDYETEAARKGYYNDWALAFVSYVGLNSHIYNGKTEKPVILFEQNEGLRDEIAENATKNDIFKNVTDKQKQELYELMIIGGCLTYHFYEKACKENNIEDIKTCKLTAEQNLKVVGINVQSTAVSPKEKFDIASFIAPPGWQRTDANGVVSFMDSKKENGVTSFCQIILYPSSRSNASANKNFQSAWNSMVTKAANSKAKPTTQTQKTPDGWTVVVGSANIVNLGLAYKTIVSTTTGFGKTMSVQVNTSGGDYASVVEKFFNDMDLDSK